MLGCRAGFSYRLPRNAPQAARPADRGVDTGLRTFSGFKSSRVTVRRINLGCHQAVACQADDRKVTGSNPVPQLNMAVNSKVYGRASFQKRASAKTVEALARGRVLVRKWE
jgi:hypothetical protein